MPKNNSQIIYFDLETTGLDPEDCGIIEIGALFTYRDGQRRQHTFESLCNPLRGIKDGRAIRRDVSVSDYATQVNGITMESLEKELPIDTVLYEFDSFVRDEAILGGWNVSGFDIPFLKTAYKRAGLKWRFHYHVCDLMNVAEWLDLCDVLPGNKGVSLQAMAKYFGVDSTKYGSAHRALPDVYTSVAVGNQMREQFLIGRSYKV